MCVRMYIHIQAYADRHKLTAENISAIINAKNGEC